MENHMELTFLACAQNEAFARVAIAAFAVQLNPTLPEMADVKTAVSEAVTNAIVHGYRDCPLELGATSPRRSVDPLDTSKYILAARSALEGGIFDV